MTDDSFLNLRGKEALVNIYYNIYNTNLIPSPIFNNCHLSSVILLRLNLPAIDEK